MTLKKYIYIYQFSSELLLISWMSRLFVFWLLILVCLIPSSLSFLAGCREQGKDSAIVCSYLTWLVATSDFFLFFSPLITELQAHWPLSCSPFYYTASPFWMYMFMAGPCHLPSEAFSDISVSSHPWHGTGHYGSACWSSHCLFVYWMVSQWEYKFDKVEEFVHSACCCIPYT